MGLLQDIFTNSDAQSAADHQKAAIQAGTTQGQADLSKGLAGAQGYYAAGLVPFQQNYTTAQGGQNAYADATGANGPAGNARAVQNFQTGPGYQFQLDQGTQNALRNKAATGQLASGSTDVDLQNLGQGAANQSWQQYISGLQPFLGAANSAAGGIGSLNAGAGNLTNTNLTNAANMDYGSNVAQGNAQANADLASQKASQNIFDAIKSGASLATGMGGFSGGGGGFGAIGPSSVGGAPLSGGTLAGSLGSFFG